MSTPTGPRPTYRADIALIRQTCPKRLTERPQWVAWYYYLKKGKWAKIPVNPHTGEWASTTDPSTHGTFEQAVAYFEKTPPISGIGFCFHPDDGLVGFDLDHTVSDSVICQRARTFLDEVDTWCEFSPTGTGIKGMAEADKFPAGHTKNYDDGTSVELYSAGRFFTITGNVCEDWQADIQPRHEVVGRIYADLFGTSSTDSKIDADPGTPTTSTTGSVSAARVVSAMLRIEAKPGENDGSKRLYTWACRGVEMGASDDAIVAAVRAAEHVAPFPAKWTDADIVKRIRDAENHVKRGSKAEQAEEVLTFSGLTIGDLMDTCPELRPVIIDGLLRQGETMNVIAAPKMGKSWLVLGLVLSLVTGRRWMGFDTKRCRVLLIDNELHCETLARRVVRVAEAMGIDREEYASRLGVQTLRGQLKDWHALGPFFATIPAGEFGVIVCDAFYRFAPKDTDENDNGSMAAIYNRIDAYADMTKAAFVLIHHTTKGIQAAKAVTDIGAGAGAQSRATDTHLVLRHHEEDGVVVLDAAVRSFAPVKARCLRWQYPLWHPAFNLDPENLRRENRRQRRDQTGAEVEKPKPEPWTVPRFVELAITSSPRGKASIMALAEGLGVPHRKAERLFRAGIESGLIHEWPHPTDKRGKLYANTKPTPTGVASKEVA